MARVTFWRFAPALSVAAVALAWELTARSGRVTPFMLPALSVVLARIWSDAQAGGLAQSIGMTLYRALAGFFIAAAIGVPMGILMARHRGMRWFFDPIVSVGFPMPKIAFLPIVTLWLGFHDVSKIAMIVFDATFPVLTAALAGTAGVEKELLWSARNLGASEGEVLREVILPAALPKIMTGLQVALPIALIVAVVAEMMMGGVGLGGAMMTSSRFADSPGVFAGIVEIAAVGYVLVKLMAVIRRRLLAWHPEVLAPPTA